MKISDKGLRETTGSVYTPCERELASELLQRRQRERRLRRAMRLAALRLDLRSEFESALKALEKEQGRG